MIIKIIDWMSKIMAVALAISGSVLAIVDIIRKLSTKAGEIQLHLQNIIVISGGMVLLIIFYSALQLGLFLAPTVREKKIIYRLGVAILMLPTSVIFFSNIVGVAKMKLLMGIPLNIADTILFSLCSIGLIVHIAQYYLLFKSKEQIQSDGYDLGYDQNKEISKGLKDNFNIQGLPPSLLEYNSTFETPIFDGLEEPLFVLRYSMWRVWVKGIGLGLLVGGIFGGMLLFGDVEGKPGLKWFSISMIIASMSIIVMSLLLKDINLYKDRIIENYHLLKQKEVKLKEAYIYIPCSWSSPHITIISPPKRWFFKISIIEDFIKPKDIKKFYCILTELSGRKMEEFSGRRLKLIKEADKQW